MIIHHKALLLPARCPPHPLARQESHSFDSLAVSHGGGTARGVTDPGGGELFIVDNSISGWTVLEYLRQWTDVARSFDITTGFFEIGALLALDGKWQQVEKVRILNGTSRYLA